MNWYKSIKSAELQAEGLPTTKQSLGLKRVFQNITPEAEQEINALYPQKRFLGSGRNGVAFEIQGNQVLKITNDRKEYESARRIFQLQQGSQSYTGFNIIYGIHEFQDDIFGIISEKAHYPLNDFEKAIIDNSYVLQRFTPGNKSNPTLFNMMLKNIYKVFSNIAGLGQSHYVRKGIKFFIKEYWNFINAIRSVGGNITDARSANIFRDKNGRLILIDFGLVF